MHPAFGSHESSVHGFLSSQSGACPPTHSPLAHVSLVVQALPSSHGAWLSTCWHPACGSHESSVQGLPSSHVAGTCVHPVLASHPSSVQGSPSAQSSGAPPEHDPSTHVSFVVQTVWSSHGPWLAACVHPVFGSHPSSVHTLPSSQSAGVPPTHCPFAHAS